MIDTGLDWHREVLGDVVEDRRMFLATRLPILAWRWHVGAPADVDPTTRPPAGTPNTPNPERKADVTVDLKADQQVTLSGSYTDEIGNPVTAPTDATVSYAVDDPAVLSLTDNGDGTAIAAATGALGAANIHAEASFGGRTATGDLQIVVVAGDAERFEVVASDPTEVTPDV